MTDIMGPMTAANAVTARPGETRTPGSTDTFFKPCSSPIARDGTTVEAALLNQWLAAMRALARGNGLKLDGTTKVVAEDNTNDAILLQAVQNLIQRNTMLYVVDGGTANGVTFTPSPAPTEYINGMRFTVLKGAADNTGAVTVNGAPLTWPNGNALVGGQWPASSPAEIVKTAAGWALLSVAASPQVFQTTSTASSIIIPIPEVGELWELTIKAKRNASTTTVVFLGVQVSIDGGATYISTSSYYGYAAYSDPGAPAGGTAFSSAALEQAFSLGYLGDALATTSNLLINPGSSTSLPTYLATSFGAVTGLGIEVSAAGGYINTSNRITHVKLMALNSSLVAVANGVAAGAYYSIRQK